VFHFHDAERLRRLSRPSMRRDAAVRSPSCDRDGKAENGKSRFVDLLPNTSTDGIPPLSSFNGVNAARSARRSSANTTQLVWANEPALQITGRLPIEDLVVRRTLLVLQDWAESPPEKQQTSTSSINVAPTTFSLEIGTPGIVVDLVKSPITTKDEDDDTMSVRLIVLAAIKVTPVGSDWEQSGANAAGHVPYVSMVRAHYFGPRRPHPPRRPSSIVASNLTVRKTLRYINSPMDDKLPLSAPGNAQCHSSLKASTGQRRLSAHQIHGHQNCGRQSTSVCRPCLRTASTSDPRCTWSSELLPMPLGFCFVCLFVAR
jgi:hypothetical protein